MSEPSQEPSRMSRMRTGVSRWRNTRRGTKTLKAAYSQAARDVKRMDPAVRERIGRANMTRADLQMLADTNIGRQFRPELYGQAAQGLEASAAARVQQAGTSAAPTRNPFRRLANRVSRWRNTRQGTKALKAAYTQAARDVKRMDPAVREAIGRSTVTKADLQAFSQGHMDQVFRPEGRNGALAQQEAQSQQVGAPQVGAADQQQVVQPQQVQQQMPQQMVQPQQDRTMQLLAEYNQLQAQAAQLLQTRIAQLQAEAAQLTAMYQAQMAQQAQAAQMLQPEAGQQQQPQPEPEVAQQPAGGAPQGVAEGAQEEPEAAQQAPENLHYVGKHRVVETQETFQPGADPGDPKNWVDVASGNAPVQPLPQVAGQQEGLDQGTEAGESAAGEPRTGNGQAELSPADMQNMHAAFGGVAKAQGSSGEQARETVAESESGDNGQHRTGQAAGKTTDSSLRR